MFYLKAAKLTWKKLRIYFSLYVVFTGYDAPLLRYIKGNLNSSNHLLACSRSNPHSILQEIGR